MTLPTREEWLEAAEHLSRVRSDSPHIYQRAARACRMMAQGVKTHGVRLNDGRIRTGTISTSENIIPVLIVPVEEE